MNSKLLYILLFWGFILSGQLAEGQIRVIDNKGTVSSIDPSKWTRIGVTNDIYNKYPGNVGIGTTSPVATLHNGGSTILGMTTAINATATYTVSAASVDGYSGVVITQTVSAATVTLTGPTNTIAGRRFTITNAAGSTFPLTIGTYTLPIGTSGEFVWNGSAWSAPSTVASTATKLATAKSIYGGSFDGSADITGIIASTYGGTGNGFTKFTGPTTTEKTFILPDASATILTSASAITVPQGGTGLTTIPANDLIYGTGTNAVSLLTPSATTGAILMNTAADAPSWSLLSGLPTSAGILPVANGGTGSSTQNWVDLTTVQSTIGGAKTWTALGTFSTGLAASGAAVSINDNSNFATNINTGTSTGAVNIASGTIGGNAISIGNKIGATSLTQKVGTGNYSLDGVGTSTYTIGNSTVDGTMIIGGTAQTGAITLGNSSAVQTVNIGTGTGASTVNIANGIAGNTVSIANGANTTAQTINIGAGANAENNTINIGSGTNTAGVTAITIGTNTNFANTTSIEGGNGTDAITLTPQTTGSIVIGATTGTGPITLGSSSAAQTVNVGTGVGASTVNIANGIAGNTVSIANSANTTAQTVNIANGLSGANSTVNILSGIGTAGTGAINLGDNPRVTTIDIGNYAPAATRTITVGGGATAVVDQINIGTGTSSVSGGKTINIGTTAPTGSGTNIVTIGAASTVAGNGVRFNTSRVVRNYPIAPTTGGAVTLTATQVLDAGIYVLNVSGTVTFPTAASLVAAMPSPQVGDVINFAIVTTGNVTPGIAISSGGTIGSQATGVARVTRYLSIRLTNITTPAYTIY